MTDRTAKQKPAVDLDAIAKSMTERSISTYREHAEKAALRCALGDAAHFCDAIGRFLREQHKGKRGHTTKHGSELAAIAKLCGDELWKMRDLIDMTQDPERPAEKQPVSA